MKLELIDFPVEIPLVKYNELIEKLISILSKEQSIISVYQMGSIRDPGISDLDLICVFKDGESCFLDIKKSCSPNDHLILTHSVFGIEESDFKSMLSYNFISNLKFLFGKDFILNNKVNICYDIKIQIALEYLLKMFISLHIQNSFKMYKVRSFLLLAKAIAFDLELLEVKSGKLFELVKKVLEVRKEWFKHNVGSEFMKKLIYEFYIEIKLFLKISLNNYSFYLPNDTIILPGNCKIIKNEFFFRKRKGLIIPKQLNFFGPKKYINLNHKFNKFFFFLPFENPILNSSIHKRFDFCEKMVVKNKNQYPYFIPLTTSLSLYN